MAKENQPTGMAHSALTVETTVTGNISASTDIRIGREFFKGILIVREKSLSESKDGVQGDHKSGQCRDYGYCMRKYCRSRDFGLKIEFLSEGNITVTTLIIEPNAHLNGQCSMRTFQK